MPDPLPAQDFRWTFLADLDNLHPVLVADSTDGVIRISVTSEWYKRIDPADAIYFGSPASVVLSVKVGALFEDVHAMRFVSDGRLLGYDMPADADETTRMAAGRQIRDGAIRMFQEYARSIFTPADTQPAQKPYRPAAQPAVEVHVAQFDGSVEGTRTLTELVKAGWVMYGEMAIVPTGPHSHRVYQRLVRRGGQ